MTEREWLQRERGLCSSQECDEPIAGWCATCDAKGPYRAPKLCALHLIRHVSKAKHEAYSLVGTLAEPR